MKALRICVACLAIGSVIASTGLWWRNTPTTNASEVAWKALERKLPAVRFREQPLEAVVRDLAVQSGVPIEVDWNAADNAGHPVIRPEDRVTLHQYNRSLRSILGHVFGAFSEQLEIVDQGSHILIAIANRPKPVFLRRYDVDTAFRQAELEEVVQPIEFDGPDVRDKYSRESGLIDLVRSSVEPDTWQENGGATGNLQILGGQLWVIQTAEGHHATERFLNEFSRSGLKSDWPSEERDQTETFPEVLARRAPGVLVANGESRDVALDRIRETFRVNINDMAPSIPPSKASLVTFRLDQPTLEAAMHEWRRQVFGEDLAAIVWVPEGDDGIDVVWQGKRTYPDKPADYEETRVYDFRSLLAREQTGDASNEFFLSFQQEVDPESWRSNGGQIGAINPIFQRQVVIHQTRSNHRLIRARLEALRAERLASKGEAK